MARLPRGEVIDPNEVAIVHAFNRTVRRCFLFGDDPLTGKNFDHRKVWIEESLEHFAACFAIDLLSFSILSNHYHLILRNRPDVVATWSDTEVARRWLMICPVRKIRGKPAIPTESELNSIRNCPLKLAKIRARLSDISWWMRLLNQRIAQRANREDEASGRFFEDRYKAVPLIDESAVLACTAYVELNPIRAAIAETLEQSDHTSVKRRIRSIKAENAEATECKRAKLADSFLAPVELNEASGDVGPCVSRSSARCSDKGFLPMRREAFIELLDWTARQRGSGKRGATSKSAPPILARLGLSPSVWSQLVADFGRLFPTLAGLPEHVDAARSRRTHRRFHLSRQARELLQHAA